MSKSKIANYESSRIAEAIAKKAFEHLLAPLDEELNTHLRAAYHTCMSKDVAAFMQERGLAVPHNAIEVLVAYGDGHVAETIRGDTGEFLVPRGYSTLLFKFLTPAETPEYARIRDARTPLIFKRGKLQDELAAQMLGKSAAKVMKTWPEVAPFVASYYQLDTEVLEMTTPLDTLLAKYLPALPAPKK